jgi:glycosyltransferase involved in cell wall biosynthesis
VIGALALGGAERFVVDLAGHLASLGWRVAVLALARRGDAVEEGLRAGLEDRRVVVHRGPTARPGIRTVRWYRQMLSKTRPRIVHLHTPNTEVAHFLALPWRLRGSRTVRTVHTTKRPRALLERMAHGWLPVAHSIACSEATLACHRSIVRGPFTVIPNGIDFRWPPRSPETVREARERLGLDPARTHVVMVGSMKGDSLAGAPKAHDVMLDAWQLVGAATSRADLHLLGDGPLRPAIESRARALPGVHLHGARTDIPSWLLAADCFVMPSRWEGMPIAALEALGTGTHCLFSDIPPLRELASPGVGYFAAGSARSLADALGAFLAAPPSAPSPEAVAELRDRFGIARAASAHQALYRSLGAA